MTYLPNPDEDKITNIQNHVGFIIQTIENHDPTMERILSELKKLSEYMRNT